MNKDMFKKLAVIFSTGDTSAVNELFSDTYVDHQRPEWMKEEGAEEFKAVVKLARSSMPKLKVEVVGPIIAEGNMVAGRLYWSSGPVERETMEILRIENGKFIEHWGAKAWSREH